MDSYYISPHLAVELLEGNSSICGTVNCNRKDIPAPLKPVQCPLAMHDDQQYVTNKKMIACTWHDIKQVTMLTSVHHNGWVPKKIRDKSQLMDFRQSKNLFVLIDIITLWEE